jgi:Kef-type K+ transport system membrane component KefB
VFFVASGVRLDLKGLVAEPSALLRVPVLLLALLLVRGMPALLYASTLGWQKSVAAGLLQATSLPFLVTAATIGVEVGTISATTGAALICAGLLSVVLFPSLAVSRLRDRHSDQATTGRSEPNRTASPDDPARS